MKNFHVASSTCTHQYTEWISVQTLYGKLPIAIKLSKYSASKKHIQKLQIKIRLPTPPNCHYLTSIFQQISTLSDLAMILRKPWLIKVINVELNCCYFPDKEGFIGHVGRFKEASIVVNPFDNLSDTLHQTLLSLTKPVYNCVHRSYNAV